MLCRLFTVRSAMHEPDWIHVKQTGESSATVVVPFDVDVRVIESLAKLCEAFTELRRLDGCARVLGDLALVNEIKHLRDGIVGADAARRVCADDVDMAR